MYFGSLIPDRLKSDPKIDLLSPWKPSQKRMVFKPFKPKCLFGARTSHESTHDEIYLWPGGWARLIFYPILKIPTACGKKPLKRPPKKTFDSSSTRVELCKTHKWIPPISDISSTLDEKTPEEEESR